MLLSKQINDFFQINVYYIVDVHINSQRGEPLLCREYYLVLATENSWYFKLSSKTKDFKFFLLLYEGENTFGGKRQSGLSTLSQYFQVYNTVSKLVVMKEQYRNNTVDSLCFKSAG